MSTHSFEHYEPVGYYQRGPIEDRVAAYLGKHMYVSEPRPPLEKATPREGKLMTFTPGYASWPAGTLFYFPVRARAECIRMIMHYGGLSYVLHTVQFADWPTLKPTMPNQCLPAWSPDGEGPMNETIDIAKAVARECGKKSLLPDDAKASKLFEMCTSGPLNDINPVLNVKPVEEATKAAPAAVKECVDLLKTVDSDLAGPFFGGAEPHIGDFAIWAAVDNISKLDSKVFDSLGAKWKEWYEAFALLKGVKEYLKCRPRMGTGKVGFPGSIAATTDLDPPEEKIFNYETKE